jgi:predicted ferric reductase
MQRFRGLDPRTQLTRWGLLAIALGIVLGGTASEAAQRLTPTLAAQPWNVTWDVSRILGFLAYLAIAGSVVYGLLLSTGLLDAIAHRPISFTLHQDLSGLGLALGMVHAAVLILDPAVPFSVIEAAVPFAAPYRSLWVGLGQVGLYVTAAVVASFYVRRRIGQRAWRLLHYVTFAAFVALTTHMLGSGSDPGLTRTVATVAGASVAFLTVYRMAIAVGGGRRAAAARAPARPSAPAVDG